VGAERAGDDAEGAGLLDEADRELQDREAEHRVEQQRQPDDHEQGAAVAELVAQLAQPDQADDGPAHGLGGPPGEKGAL
jgi:hypothetical protein